MPNQPRTPNIVFRCPPNIVFRCPPDLREALERIADERGETLTDLLRRIAREYVANWPGQSPRS